jgi:restriction endonuclease S subunit
MRLGEFVTLRRGHDLPERLRRVGRIPVIGSGGRVGFHDEAIARGPGITLGRATNLGAPTLVREDFWPLNTTLYITDFHGNDVRFAYYLFRSLDLTGFDSGSVQPMLNRNYIRNIGVTIPEVLEQRAIADVLGALDDKIATNERIKMTGRCLAFAQYEQALAQSDSLIDLGSICISISRGITPKYTDSQSAMIVLNQKCIRDGWISLRPARRTFAVRVRETQCPRRHDVLVNSTGMGTLGRVARWTRGLDVTVDSHVTVVRFDPDAVDPVCAGYGMLVSEPDIEMLGEGSTGQTELSRARLAQLRIPVPDKGQQTRVRQVLESLDDLADRLDDQSNRLGELRDTLLPKLISGEIRVREAERVVEEVT